MRPLRLLHFDLKGLTNYGDTVLFDAVRQLFNGFGGGVFEMHDTFSLHRVAGDSVINEINESFDAVVVGGGGLFLRDTNPNPNSGWQWNIPMAMLRRLRKPIIVFAVGYNRFPGQEDFDDIFGEHLALCLEKSCFFGLRNHGSIEAIRHYLPAELHARIELQPCPTTIASHLYPDVTTAGERRRAAGGHDEMRLGVQLMVDRRMVAAGYDFERLFDRHARVLCRLQRDGWRVDTVAHMANEGHVAAELRRRGVETSSVDLFESPESTERGLSYYGGLPIMYGARGHATMIPFGLGAIPLAVLVHDKVRY
ncbi:MAG: polysaccharide pyruvyl transferase family protein, partial [Actinomycetota bacterium]|nr:polysaccharide pyruvyl transferase family protein [Actinomycetota bacterium]